MRITSSTFLAIAAVTAVISAENARVEFAFGVLAESRMLETTAADHFEKARLADPLALPLVQQAVKQRLAVKDRSGAVKLYRDLAVARPDNLRVQLIYTDFLDQHSNGDTLALQLSHDALQAALAKNPGHPQIIQRLFKHAQAAADKKTQLDLMEMLSKEDPESALLFTSLARAIFTAEDAAARGKIDQRFLTSFEAHPENPQLARAASEHFRESSRPDQAIAILKRHVEVAPSSLEMRTRLGVLYFAAKRDAEGEAELKAVLEISPRQALAHQALAKFYRLGDHADAARFHAGELLKIRGGSAADFIKLADEWLAANDPKQARILLEKAVYDQPDKRDLVEKLAIATRRDPETRAQATPIFRQAEATKPVDEKTAPTFLIESAEAFIADGQTKSAEERLRLAIKAYPADAKKDTAAALRRLAQIWETERRNADAARALRQRADALDP